MAYTTIYYYDYETKVFGGTGLMPEGVSLADYAPDSATLTPPGEPERGFTFVWDEDAGEWLEVLLPAEEEEPQTASEAVAE